MKRLQRWVPLIWVCAVSLVAAACARSAPEQLPGEGGAAKPVESSAPAAPMVASPLALSPSPAYPGTYAGTPTPNPTPASHSDEPGVESYVVQPGETLGLIAAVFGCTVEEIVAVNGLPDEDSISIGQTLVIPIAATETGPALKLIPDSELVYGPAYVHFDLEGFVAGRGGYLADYAEEVEGRLLTGVEIVQLVSQRFSVGPRVLLALLELQAGWVTDPQPAAGTLVYPLGHVQEYHEGLFQQLSGAAVWLNEGYYGWKRGDSVTVHLTDGSRAAIAPGLNPGTAGVQNCLAELCITWDEWLALTGPDGFLVTYESLFGNPFAYTVDPLVPPDLVQPELRLPW
ncbi:MAG: LysM peptidoglycan-binding domain-containing protein, partial [Anaerolineae bacterium]|nr:LysM peptidoglycan-binding domain-containing protein [Anaerolineae bacterium]